MEHHLLAERANVGGDGGRPDGVWSQPRRIHILFYVEFLPSERVLELERTGIDREDSGSTGSEEERAGG